MRRIDDAFEQFRALLEVDDQRRDKAYVVGIPLAFSGELFKTIFSYTIGFRWFINFSYKWYKLPRVKISLPTISYVVGLSDFMSEGERYRRYIMSGGMNYDYSLHKFLICENNYRVNPVNFLAVFLDYIARNVGKWVGWLIVSPFTIPTHYITKLYYLIKTKYRENQLNKILQEINPVQLVSAVLDSPVNFGKFGEVLTNKVNTKDFLQGWWSHSCKNSEISKRSDYSGLSGTVYFDQFKSSRDKFLNNDCKWAVAKTIISGLILFPLIFTIPWCIKKHRNKNTEIRLLNENAEIIKQVENDKGDLLFYNSGRELLKSSSPCLGILYLSKISQSSNYYKDAMTECGHYFLSINQADQALPYFEKIGDNEGQRMALNLIKNPNITVSEMQKIPHVEIKVETDGLDDESLETMTLKPKTQGDDSFAQLSKADSKPTGVQASSSAVDQDLLDVTKFHTDHKAQANIDKNPNLHGSSRTAILSPVSFLIQSRQDMGFFPEQKQDQPAPTPATAKINLSTKAGTSYRA